MKRLKDVGKVLVFSLLLSQATVSFAAEDDFSPYLAGWFGKTWSWGAKKVSNIGGNIKEWWDSLDEEVHTKSVDQGQGTDLRALDDMTEVPGDSLGAGDSPALPDSTDLPDVPAVPEQTDSSYFQSACGALGSAWDYCTESKVGVWVSEHKGLSFGIAVGVTTAFVIGCVLYKKRQAEKARERERERLKEIMPFMEEVDTKADKEIFLAKYYEEQGEQLPDSFFGEDSLSREEAEAVVEKEFEALEKYDEVGAAS